MSPHHQQGQQDAARNSYRPPHGGLIRQVFRLWTPAERADRQDYQNGWSQNKSAPDGTSRVQPPASRSSGNASESA